MTRTMEYGGRLAAAAVLLSVAAGCGSGINFGALAGANSQPVANAAPNGPQLGYAWKVDDRTLRPLMGIFGSAQVGASVVPAGTYNTAAGSVASRVAVLVGHDGQVYRMTLPDGSPAAVNASVSQDSTVRLSPSGTAAVLFLPGASTATVLTGLGGTPSSRTVTFAAGVADASVGDAGSVAAIVGTTGKTAVAVLGAGSSSATTLPNLGTAGVLSFTGTTDDLLVADAKANTLTLVHAASTAPNPQQVSTGSLLKGPLAVGSTLDSHWAVVANGGENSVVRVDLSGATAPQRIACPVAPQYVERLSGNGNFRFTDVGSSPAWTADIGSAAPAMRFIPALPGSRS